MPTKRLTMDQRKEIFHALVATQDAERNVRKSYDVVTERYAITPAQLRQIEDEGVDKEWPPLNEPVSAAG